MSISVNIKKLVFPEKETPSLRNIDLTIADGDFVVLVGPPAGGKSLLLHVLTGAVPAYYPAAIDGSVSVDGKDRGIIPLPALAGSVGYMMQEPQNQLVDINVFEDVAFGPGNLALPREEVMAKAREALDFVGLSGFENRRTDALSGGEAQRVVLAGVIAMSPQLLLLDQPTAELDPAGRRAVYENLGRLNREKGVSICMVMDRAEEVLTYAKRVIMMENGQISAEYSAAAYARQRRQEMALRLAAKKPSAPCGAATAVSLRHCGYSYKKSSVGCEDVNLEIKEGEFTAILGVNGSGKSTLAKLMGGLVFPTEGEVAIFGAVPTKKNRREIRKHVGFLFQNPDYQIFADTVYKEAAFGLAPEELDRVDEALEKVGLLQYRDLHPQKLSRGQRQLLAFASVLVHRPRLLIADEPTAGLDEDQGMMLMEHVRALHEEGATVLFITHDLFLAKYYARRVLVMGNHRLCLDLNVAETERYKEELQRLQIDFGSLYFHGGEVVEDGNESCQVCG